MTSENLKKTALYQWHVSHGAKMVPFAGWVMPVSYTSQIEEHVAVRRSAGVFDVSHMGEILIEGQGAEDFCDWLLPNKLKTLSCDPATGGYRSSYNPLCREDGTLVDDVYAYYLSPTKIFICVNAANVDKDFVFMQDQAKRWGFTGQVHNRSDAYGQVAVQGPQALALIEVAFPEWGINRLKRFRCVLPGGDPSEMNLSWIISRTGYTGEQGVEIYMPPGDVESMVDKLMRVAADRKIECVPAGLGARDTLRLEAGYPLYGHELDDKHTAIESGLARFCDFSKPDFCGKRVLMDHQEHPEKRAQRLVGLRSESRRAPRQGQSLMDGEVTGRVVSGAFSPTLGVGIGMGFITDLGRPLPRALTARFVESDRGELILKVVDYTQFLPPSS